MLKKIICAVLAIFMLTGIANADTQYFWRYRSSANVSGLTDGKVHDLAYDTTTHSLYVCTVAPSTWVKISGATSATDKQVLFQDGVASISGDAGLLFDKSTDILTTLGGYKIGSDTDVSLILLTFLRATTDVTLNWNETLDQLEFNYPVSFGGVNSRVEFSDDTNLQFDLDGTRPIISSPQDTIIEIAETLQVDEALVFDSEYDNGNSGLTKTIDWRLGNCQKLTLTGTCNLAFSPPDGPARLTLRLIQDAGGSKTVNPWPVTVKWEDGVAPTLTATGAAVDIIDIYYNGTNYYASFKTDFK